MPQKYFNKFIEIQVDEESKENIDLETINAYILPCGKKTFIKFNNIENIFLLNNFENILINDVEYENSVKIIFNDLNFIILKNCSVRMVSELMLRLNFYLDVIVNGYYFTTDNTNDLLVSSEKYKPVKELTLIKKAEIFVEKLEIELMHNYICLSKLRIRHFYSIRTIKNLIKVTEKNLEDARKYLLELKELK